MQTVPNNAFPSLDSIQFSSVAGIIVATTIIVAVLMRSLGDKPFFGKVPAFVYVTGISLILTFLANRVWKLLPGSIGVLLWDSAKSALASSGFYTWVTGRAGAIEKSGAVAARQPSFRVQTLSLWLTLILLLGVSGCVTRPELITLREGMDQATATIRKQHLEWSEKLYEGKQSELPTLTTADYHAVLAANKEYEDLVNSSRAQDQPGPATQP